jgi:citrate synthase
MTVEELTMHPAPIEAVISRVLRIGADRVTDDLSYHSIPQWDSLQHVALMLALEVELGVTIDAQLTLQLSSVSAIRAFADAHAHARSTAPAAAANGAPAAPASTATASPGGPGGPVIHRGLDGVYVDRTAISRIDGERGMLEYRGYSIHDLATRATFEATAYLLIHGELPDPGQLASFTAELVAARAVPAPVLAVMRALGHAHPMEALRTGISTLGAFDPDAGDDSAAATLRKGVRLIAQVPVLIGAHHAARQQRALVAPPPELSHAACLLHLLRGGPASPTAARLIDRDLIVHADHSSNASAFTARVVIGCKSGIHGALTAAVSAFAGQLHGGAAERVMTLVDAIGEPSRAEAYVAERLVRNEPVMGFGHRVYRTEDPRVRHLRDAALEASRERGDLMPYEVIAAVVEAMKPYARHGVDANVDLYSGLLYRMLELPNDLAVPIFVAGRMAGWVAQALEQHTNNILIRPLLHYAGPTGRSYPSSAR